MAGLGQSLGQALGQFAFGSNTQDATMKGMLAGSQANQFDASAKKSLAEALKAEAESRLYQQQEDARKPEAIFRNAIQQFGMPSDDAPAIESFIKTGALGGRFAPSMDGMGPVTPQPDWARNLPGLVRSMGNTNRALTLGDKSVENAAKADQIGRDIGLSDSIIAGTLNRNTVGGAQAAVNGKPLFNSDANGAVLDLFNGKLNESGGIAQGTITLKKEQAGAQKANAVQSYAAAGASNASAGNSNASAAKTRQETAQGGKTGQTQIVTDANGNVTLIDKATGQARPATYADGTTVGAKAGAAKPLTEGQAKAVAFASRMENSNSIVDGLAAAGVNKSVPGSRAGYGVGAVVNAFQPQQRQQLDQAKRDFINANLRRESGAVISDSEFTNAEIQYFPQPGDGPKVIAQKAANRRIALDGMKADIPANLGDVTGDIVRKSGGGNAPDKTPTAGAVQDGFRFKGGNPSDPKSWEKM